MLKLTTAKIILVALVVFNVMNAGNHYDQKGSVKKVLTNDTKAPMTINNIFSYYYNNGDGSKNSISDDGGFEVINNRRGITIFQEGLFWGGMHKGKLKVGGSTYNHGLQAGPILTPGTATTAPTFATVGDAKYRIYRVRPDINPKTPLDAQMRDKIQNEEVALIEKYESVSVDDIYNAYIKDWNEWPATDGAPYNDVNKNGKYDAATDVPGVPGADQTMWYVANDLDQSRTLHLYASDPIGIEFQRTIWAYKLTGALGNTIFQKNVLINKSGAPIDSMFVSQWADPDVGGGLGYTDDFTGCDTTLGLGYVYNGTNNDGFFGATPPAMGFDFFQGPIVKGGANDVAKFKGGTRAGYKNLGMSAFNFFINSNALYRDPQLDNAAGLQQAYNLLNGLVTTSGAAYVNPKTGLVTKYVLSGDPVGGTGWVDGQIAGPGDRRMALCSGPFTMAAGDTQEVVVAAIVGQGANRLSSVSVLKYYDQLAQRAYDVNFDLPTPPTSPVVAVTEMDKEVVLDWSIPANFSITEGQDAKGYKFEGYNIYQLPTAGFDNAKLLATYDVVNGVRSISDNVYNNSVGTVIYVPVQSGNDYGVARFFDVKRDYINDKPLVNGQAYYFAVTAYNYNPDTKAVPVQLESSPLVIKVIPQAPLPGQRFNAEVSALVDWTTAGPVNDGSIIARVVNPKKVTGDNYTIKIDTTGGKKKWSLVNSAGATLIANRTIWDDLSDNPIVDGIQWGVLDLGASGGINRVVATKIGETSYGAGANILRTAPTGINWCVDAAGATSRATALTRLNWGSAFGTSDYEVRFTAAGSEFYIGGGSTVDNPKAAAKIPVEVWNISTNKRLTIKVLDDNTDGKYNTSVGNTNLTESGTAWERIYVTPNPPYAEPLPAQSGASASTEQPIGRLIFVPLTGTTEFPPAGTVIKLISNKPINAANTFAVSTAGMQMTTSGEVAKLDVQKVNVFPNPYFGFNTKEQTKYNRFVTFNHLPVKATLSILNIAGVRVRTLLKDDPTQFTTWDLKNEAGLPIASGMYVVYIDMGELGTKILKLAVIQETQQLDKY